MSDIVPYGTNGLPSIQRGVDQQKRSMEYVGRLSAAAIDGISDLHVYAVQRVALVAAAVGSERAAAERTGLVTPETIQAMGELDRVYCQGVERVLVCGCGELVRRAALASRSEPPAPTIIDRLLGG